MNHRMAAIIKMLSSKHEAEVISAARALGLELVRHGVDWNDLGSYLARWNGIAEAPAPPPPPPPPRAADVRPRAQTYTGKARPATGWERRSRDPDPVDIDLVNSKLSELGGFTHRMKRQDRDFVESLIEKFDMYQERTFVSPPQRDWVDNLYRNFIESSRRGRR
jgi:hypothetical protein